MGMIGPKETGWEGTKKNGKKGTERRGRQGKRRIELNYIAHNPSAAAALSCCPCFNVLLLSQKPIMLHYPSTTACLLFTPLQLDSYVVGLSLL